MVLIVSEIGTRFTADTTGFTTGAQSVKDRLLAIEQSARETGAEVDAYWRQIGQTAQASTGIERLSGTVQGLQRQMQTLGEQHPDIRFTDNGEAIAQQLSNLQTRLAELSGKPYSVELRANTALLKEDLARVQTQIKEIQAQSISLNTGGATREVENLGGVLDHLSGVALPLVGFTAAEAFKQAADASIEWQTTLVELQNNTGVTTAHLNEMADSIRQVQAESNVSSSSLAEAEMHITNFGFRGAAATQVLEEAMKSASSTGGDTAKTAELLANAMHEYGNEAYTAQQAVDILHVAAQVGVGTFEQFASASGQAVGVAANLHVPLEQVTAAIAALTQHGYTADEATTQMVAALTHIINPAQEAQGELERLSKATGVDLVNDFSAAGLSSRGFTGVLDDLHLAYAKMGFSEEQATQQTMELLNAQRGGLGVATLLGTGAKDYSNTLTLMASAMSGQTTPTQDAFNRSLETTGYQLGILGNNLDVAKTRLGDFATQSSTTTAAIKFLNDALQGSNAGWKAVEQEPEKYAGALADLHATLRALPAGGLLDALFPKAEDMEARAKAVRDAAATELTQMQADIRVHNRNVDDAMQEGGAVMVEDVNKAWKDAQQAQLEQMHQMNDEAAVLAMANADAVYDPHVSNVQRMAQVAAQEAEAYINTLVQTYGTGQPAVDAYLKFLLQRHDMKDAFAIMGHNNAIAFLNALVTPVANGLEKMAQGFANLPGMAGSPVLDQMVSGIRKASQTMMGEWGQMSQQWSGFTGGFDAGAVKVEAAHKKATNAAEKAAAAAAKAAAARAKAAETAARQEVASTETVTRALEQAAQQSGASATGVGQPLVTLMNLLKAQIPPDMAFVKDAIVGELDAANRGAPPTVQALHDKVVGILHTLAGDSRQEVRLMASAALEQLNDFTDQAATKAEQAAGKMNAALVKAHQQAIEGLGKLGELLTDPKANIGDVTVAMLDAQKAAVDAQLPALASTYQQYLDQIASGTSVSLGQVRQTVVSQLQTMQQGSDPVMAAWATAMIAKMDEVAQKAQADAQQVFEAQAQAREALLQVQRGLTDELGTVGSDLISGAGDPQALLDMLKLVQDASKTGAADLAGTFTQIIGTVNNGGKVLTEQTLNTVRAFLTELSQSADTETAMMARKVLANLDKMQADATKQAQQAAQQAASTMEQAGQGMVQGLARAAQDMQTPGKTLTDVLVDMMPIMQQATAAGMPQVAATIQQYLDQARAGGTISIQGLHDALVRMLQDAQQSGDQSVALFAQQAIEQLNQVAQQAQTTASLQAYQQAQQDAQAAVQQTSETLTRQQKVLQDLQKQLQDAQKAQQDFANAPLQGEHAANEAQFQNQQQQNQLSLQITQLQFQGAPRAQIEALQHQLDTVRQQGDILRLQTSTTFDPLHHAIEQAVTDTKELTYQDAISGAVAQKKAVADLQAQIATQTRVVDQAQAAQERAQAAAQAASQAYQEQQQALQQLQQQQQQSLLQMAQMAQQMQAAGTQAQTTGTQINTGMTAAAGGVASLSTTATNGLTGVLPAYEAIFKPTADGQIFNLLFNHDTGFFTVVDNNVGGAMEYSRTEVWTSQFGLIKDLIQQEFGKLVSAGATGAHNVGNAIGQGIKQGIADEVSAIAQEAAAAVTAAIQAARDAADAHSPSEESRKKVGAPIGQGIARGIRDTAAESAAAARAHVQGAIGSAAGAVASAAGIGAGGVGGAPIQINNYLTAQLSMADLTNPAFWDGAIGRAISIALQRRGAMRQPNGAPA